ncbi:hypothetical protein IAR50_006131 [Cryptococcus sp. DSM 104548]
MSYDHNFSVNIPFHANFLPVYPLSTPTVQPQEAPCHIQEHCPSMGPGAGVAQPTWDGTLWPPAGPWALPTNSQVQRSEAGLPVYPRVESNQSPPQAIFQSVPNASTSHHLASAFDLAGLGNLYRYQPHSPPAPVPVAAPAPAQLPVPTSGYPDQHLPEHLRLPWVVVSPQEKVYETAHTKFEYGDRYQQLLQTKLSDAPGTTSASFLDNGTGIELCSFGEVETQVPVTGMNVGERFEELLRMKMGHLASGFSASAYETDAASKARHAAGEREAAGGRYQAHAGLHHQKAPEDGWGMMFSETLPAVIRRSSPGFGYDVDPGPRIETQGGQGQGPAWRYDSNIPPPLPRTASTTPGTDSARSQELSGQHSRPVPPPTMVPTVRAEAGYLEKLVADYFPRPLTQQDENQAYPQPAPVPAPDLASRPPEQSQSLVVPVGERFRFHFYAAGDSQVSSEWETANSATTAVEGNFESQVSFSISSPLPTRQSGGLSNSPAFHPPALAPPPPTHSEPISLPKIAPKETSPAQQSPDTPPILKIKVHNRNLHPTFHDLRNADNHPHIRTIPSTSAPPLLERSCTPSLGDVEGVEGGDADGDDGEKEPQVPSREQGLKLREKSEKVDHERSLRLGENDKRKASKAVDDGESSSESEEEGFLRKGKNGRKIYAKTSIACNYCRVKKMKCDGVRPICSHCARRKDTDCVFSPVVRRRGPAKAPRRRAKPAKALRNPDALPPDDKEMGDGDWDETLGGAVSTVRDGSSPGGNGKDS